jgi:hypothetical protein
MTAELEPQQITENPRKRSNEAMRRYLERIKGDPVKMAARREAAKRWKERNLERVREAAREYARVKRDQAALERHTEMVDKFTAGPAKMKQAAKGGAPKPKLPTSGMLKRAQEDIGWREVCAFGDMGTEVRAWLRGLVIRYEYVNSRTYWYAPLFDTTGKRYKSAAEAQREAMK